MESPSRETEGTKATVRNERQRERHFGKAEGPKRPGDATAAGRKRADEGQVSSHSVTESESEVSRPHKI